MPRRGDFPSIPRTYPGVPAPCTYADQSTLSLQDQADRARFLLDSSRRSQVLAESLGSGDRVNSRRGRMETLTMERSR